MYGDESGGKYGGNSKEGDSRGRGREVGGLGGLVYSLWT